MRQPRATSPGWGRRWRALVRSTRGTSDRACGRCHRPASSRVLRTRAARAPANRPNGAESGHPAGPGSTECGPPSRPRRAGGRGPPGRCRWPGCTVGRRPLAQAARRPLGSAGRGEDRQPELGQVGDATELLLHEAHVVDGALAPGAEAGQRPQRRGQAEPPAAASRARRPVAGLVPGVRLQPNGARRPRRRPAGASPGRSPWGRPRAAALLPGQGVLDGQPGVGAAPVVRGRAEDELRQRAPARGMLPRAARTPRSGSASGGVGARSAATSASAKVRSGRYGGAEDEAHAATRSSGARRVEARDLVRVEPAQGAWGRRAELLLQVPAHGHAPRAGEEPAGIGGRASSRRTARGGRASPGSSPPGRWPPRSCGA